MNKQDYVDVEDILGKYATSQVVEIPRLKEPTNEELEAYLFGTKTPFIANGRLGHWNTKNWTLEHFKGLAGASMVNPLTDLPDSGNPYFWNDKNYSQKMTLSEFIDLMMEKPEVKCYLGQKHIERYPGVEKDFDFNDIVGRRGNREPFTSIWLGSKDTHSGLHFDRRDNIFVQAVGRKFVILAPPDQAKNLYPIRDMFEKSSVDPAQPDFTAFPRLSRAQVLIGVVHPGDFMFIPRLWWHYLRALDRVISLNHWYGEEVSLIDLFKVISAGGIGHWYTTVKHGILFGALKRSYQTRQLSDMPSGLLIYNAIASGITRRFSRQSNSPKRARSGR